MAIYDITNGPSKFDLMLALFDSTCDHRRPVQFIIRLRMEQPLAGIVLGDPEEHEVHINGVSQESGDGQNWIFHGWERNPEGSTKPTFRVEGYFNTARREGWLKYVS